MKVFDLACDADHRFEGWFASAGAFDDQSARGLIECPVCASREIRKLLSAPRINLGAVPSELPRHDAPGTAPPNGPAGAGSMGQGPAHGRAPAPPDASGDAPRDVAQFQRHVLQAMRRLLESTEDVGPRFAEEARRIHYAESPERAIRGQATPQEAESLRDEGIDVFALPIPAALKGPLQ